VGISEKDIALEAVQSVSPFKARLVQTRHASFVAWPSIGLWAVGTEMRIRRQNRGRITDVLRCEPQVARVTAIAFGTKDPLKVGGRIEIVRGTNQHLGREIIG
jgi:hypothetical protein